MEDKPKPISKYYSWELNDLIFSMLNKNPHLWPSIDDILNNSFIKSFLIWIN